MCFVIQSCLTRCDPMNCSPPGSSVHDFSRQESQNGLLCPLSGIFLTQGWNPYLLSLFCTMETLSLAKHFPREGCLACFFPPLPPFFFSFYIFCFKQKIDKYSYTYFSYVCVFLLDVIKPYNLLLILSEIKYPLPPFFWFICFSLFQIVNLLCLLFFGIICIFLFSGAFSQYLL